MPKIYLLYQILKIRTYQEAAESNNNQVSEINIFDAINFVSDAWNQVTTETIKNSWEKTNIINQNTTDLMVDDLENQSEVNEINSLITQLPFQDHLGQ
nr:9383_t:CDS:2 [Entrophospora candida]